MESKTPSRNGKDPMNEQKQNLRVPDASNNY